MFAHAVNLALAIEQLKVSRVIQHDSKTLIKRERLVGT
jgi:hypothetical protein